MIVKILDPTVAAEPAESPMAKRSGTLDGKVLGLLANGKVNGDRLLDLVADELRTRYDVREIVRLQKRGASVVAEDPIVERLAAECDAVVTAIGD